MQITSVKGKHGGETEANQDNNLFLDIVTGESSSHKAPKIQVRKVSIAKWDEKLELGEVIDNKGCIWKNTGIIRNGKLYCHIEELLFLVDKGALILRNIDNTTHGIKDIILKVASGKAGCSWEAFLAYRHLKSLGYIAGRYNTPWTMKNKEVEISDDFKHDQEVEEHISGLISDMQLAELKPTFQVHFPNSGFKKSLPGDPGFILCVLWGRPPSRVEAETLQKKCGRIPLKFCFVDHGRISFFSHQNFALPTLQVERDNEEILEGNQSISSLLAVINNDTSSSKIQFSNQVSMNGCHETLKLEDINKRNDIWKNRINQNGKLDCHIEGKLEIPPLECIDNESSSKEENHLKLANEKKAWARDVLETCNYLTSLGYIVRHFDSPWSIKNYKGDWNSIILEETTKCSVKHDHEVEEEICTLLADMQMSVLRPTFNVYYHHSSFKKSDPGFIVCLLWERPPSKKEAENLQKKCGNIPLKFCFVDDRHVSFFSYDKIVLPTLP